MTVDSPHVVLALLTEDARLRVYRYRHVTTGLVLYACFPAGQYDDMAWAPEVTDVVLLYDHGHWTEDGARWLPQERSAL